MCDDIPRREKLARLNSANCEISRKQLKALTTFLNSKNFESQPPEEVKEMPIIFTTKRRYSETSKLRALELAHQHGFQKVAANTGIPETTIRRWSKVGVKKIGVSGRIPLFPAVEAELVNVFRDNRAKGLMIINSHLLQEARKIALRQKNPQSIGTMSSLQGIKKRQGICYRRHTRVAQKLPQDAPEKIEAFSNRIKLLFEEHAYDLKSVVKIDETGFFFDSFADQTLEFKVSLLLLLF